MGKAVADRTINRPGEKWANVADRVAKGNASLTDGRDYKSLKHHLSQASLLMSGRHLQHGDASQKTKPMEVMTNCSTAMLRSLTFKLLLAGSGVGSCYDDDLMIVDWSQMPIVVPVIDATHPDVIAGHIQGYSTLRDAEHMYGDHQIIVYKVEDTREGWAKAIEKMEAMAFHKWFDIVLILDFSDVREKGQPIKGMQNRPASGPGPLMAAIGQVAALRGTNMPPWRQAMYADHFLAACVLVGGARRSARIAVKHWTDQSIFDFIQVKRPIEYLDRDMDSVIDYRKKNKPTSFLWSANNSVAVDSEFWTCVELYKNGEASGSLRAKQAFDVWEMVMACQYGDGTGEPGFLNVDLIQSDQTGLDEYLYKNFAGSERYKFDHDTQPLIERMTEAVLSHHYNMIVNPCGEIALFMLGGFCVLGSCVPYFAKDDDDAEDAFRTAARALIRVNLMPSIYGTETARTNRIGVGLLGIHEYAWSRFGLGFKDLVAPDPTGKSMMDANDDEMVAPHPDTMPFWNMLKRFSDAVTDEADKYSDALEVNRPHTLRTCVPAGTISKLFGLTEGAHLPSKREYLRWVQFVNGDPLIAKYKKAGYPVRQLVSYAGTTIVGFPTAPLICTLGMGDKLMTASEATPEEQFRWVRLLETFYLGSDRGNQISYTLKYDPKKVSYKAFEQVMFDNVKKVRAVSVLPEQENLSYEYQPEQPMNKQEFENLVRSIEVEIDEDIDKVHVECAGGACPIDFNKQAA
jgi:adenosylcobalamin-dependent ribonucleoside-triphosphate reductase